jgi:hypothetical protein
MATEENEEITGEDTFPPIDNTEFDGNIDENIGDEYQSSPEEEPTQELDPLGYEVEELPPGEENILPHYEAPSYPPREAPHAPIPTGGVLFTPDNDPLKVLPVHQLPDSPKVEKWVSKRLRHLVTAPVQPVFKEPSGRNRPKDRY